DAGQRLQVQGDAFIKGSGNTSATTALTVQNSAGTGIFSIRNDQTISINALTKFGNVELWQINDGNYGTSAVATELKFETTFISGTTTGGFGYGFGLFNSQRTSASVIAVSSIFGTFVPTSGTQTFAILSAGATINQTGGANGITRGLYVNPTLTAAADWRSIEWSNNSGWGLYGAGTANNYLGGRLGINATTVNAAWMLGVTGNIQLSGFLSFGSVASAASNAYIDVQASEVSIYAGAGRKMSFWTDGSVKATLTTAGRLLLGTTTEGTYLLDVNGTSRFSQQSIFFAQAYVSKVLNSATIVNSSTDASVLLFAPTTTNNYGGVIGWAEGGAILAASISAYDDGSGGALGLSFATGNNTALAERLKISSTGAATFSSLAGTGTRMVVADTNGLLSTQSIGSGSVTGTGTTNFLPKWTSGTALGNSNLINDASGNLGLGVTPSAWITASGRTAIEIGALGNALFGAGSSDIRVLSNVYVNTSNQRVYANNGLAGEYQIADGAHIWRTAASGTANSTISFTQAMTLLANGNLLVGTTTDAGYKLDVNGTARVSGGTLNDLFI
ncbi:MAG: hypothetical protein ACOVOV_04860, partial [Dolichospermum sp.]